VGTDGGQWRRRWVDEICWVWNGNNNNPHPPDNAPPVSRLSLEARRRQIGSSSRRGLHEVVWLVRDMFGIAAGILRFRHHCYFLFPFFVRSGQDERLSQVMASGRGRTLTEHPSEQPFLSEPPPLGSAPPARSLSAWTSPTTNRRLTQQPTQWPTPPPTPYRATHAHQPHCTANSDPAFIGR